MKTQVVVLLTVLLTVLGAVAEEPVISLMVVPPTVRVAQTGAVEGAATADIQSARNECESFQVVVTAVGAPVHGVEVDASSLTGPDGKEIPDSRITLFREVYVPIRHSAPHATCAPGLVVDPLVPFVNPYTGDRIREPRWKDNTQEGPRFGAGGFDVWEDQHQPIWVDVFVPVDAAAGEYTGKVTVKAANAKTVELPVKLTVWDFALPAGPTMESHFGGFNYLASYYKIKPDSENYQILEDRYSEMLAAHRINPCLPDRLLPKVAEDGTATFDEATDKAVSDFVSKCRVTNIDVPRPPFKDPWNTEKDKTGRFYRSWCDYLEKKGWLNRAYLYMLDEPNDPDAYNEVRMRSKVLDEVEPRLRKLVVEQPYTQAASWGVLDGAIDIWCPLFGFIDEENVKRVQAQRDTVWSYTALVQTAPPYHPQYERVKNDLPPFWQIDFPVTSYRIASWVNRRYGITGLLYWQTVFWKCPDRNPWDDPGFRIRWNGDGFLFYPGDQAGIEGPVTSVRLKNIRDGLEDYEYFALLDARGGKDVADEIVRAAVPTWGSWKQDPMTMLELRKRLAEEIVRRAKG